MHIEATATDVQRKKASAVCLVKRTLLFALSCAALLPCVQAAEPLTLTLRELFGTSHPDQLVEFELKEPVDGATHRLFDETGVEAPFQVIDAGRKMIIRSDLPAGATKTWKLERGRSAAMSAVQVVQMDRYFEITNALTGVRVPIGSAGESAPAPIQGLRYRDGMWTATNVTVNLLSLGSAEREVRITGTSVRFLERGPLKVVAEIAYQFADTNRFCTSTIEVQAGQPSILIEEDGNVNTEYALNLAPGLNPTEGRYRHASDQNPEAVVPLELGVAKRYGRMATWDPWAGQQKRGWSWQLYDANGGDSANLFGMFAGRASRSRWTSPACTVPARPARW